MLGAILGDIIGSRFEFDRGGKTKDFRLFTNEDSFTDDTVMTVAVAEGLMNAGIDADEKTVKENLIKSMQHWGQKYPYAGYGARFIHWVHAKNPEPYNSFGNGSAMRVSSVGFVYDSLEKTMEVARWSAEVSHNHPEGIKGAECTAAVMYLSRTGKTKENIRDFVLSNYDYDLSESLDEMRKRHEHIETCMDSMPKALVSFFEGNSYEDVIRNAVSLGGDTDTLAAIAGAMAEAYYGIPEAIEEEGGKFISEDMQEVIDRFYSQKEEFIELDDFSNSFRDDEKHALTQIFGREEAEKMMKEEYEDTADFKDQAALFGLSEEEYLKQLDEEAEIMLADVDEMLDADDETLKEKWSAFAMQTLLGFDENVANNLVEKGYAFNDLSGLSKDDFMNILGIGDKKAAKIAKAVKDYCSENELQAIKPEEKDEETVTEKPIRGIRFPEGTTFRINDDGIMEILHPDTDRKPFKKKESKTEELREKVRNLRIQGLSYKKIGEQLGISGAYAHILDKPDMYKTDEKKAKLKEYKDKAKEHNLEYGKKWRDKNPDYMKKWYQENKDKYKKYQENRKEKLSSDEESRNKER